MVHARGKVAQRKSEAAEHPTNDDHDPAREPLAQCARERCQHQAQCRQYRRYPGGGRGRRVRKVFHYLHVQYAV